MTILQYLKDAYDYDVVKVWNHNSIVNIFTVKELLDSRSGLLKVEPMRDVVIPECGIFTFDVN